MQWPWQKSQREPSMKDFQSDNWKDLSEKERLSALQYLEKSIAQEQGRKARIIHPKAMNDRSYGEYDKNTPSKIYINQEFLSRKDSSEYGNSYHAMGTILHEGRHAYQDDCIKEKLLCKDVVEPTSDVTLWKQNMEIYNHNYGDEISYVRYRFQPVEQDANLYSEGKMNSYKALYQDDERYQHYIDNLKSYKSSDISDALRYLGPEYQKDIAREISETYKYRHNSKEDNLSVDKTNCSNNYFNDKGLDHKQIVTDNSCGSLEYNKSLESTAEKEHMPKESFSRFSGDDLAKRNEMKAGKGADTAVQNPTMNSGLSSPDKKANGTGMGV